MAPSLSRVALAFLLASPPLPAQVVVGRLVTSPSAAPLAGTLVELVDADGVPVSATLTDAAGAFRLTASEPGRYVVRAGAAGQAVDEAETTLAAARPGEGPVSTVDMELVAAALDLDLPTSALVPDRRCRLAERDSVRVAALWREVRKALRATSLAEDTGLHSQERRTWIRQLDPDDLSTLDEDLRPLTAFLPGSPIHSPPPEELAQFGFIQGGDGEGYSFYAPDTRTLLSPIFSHSHCLGFEDEGPVEGWIGLTFRPRFEGGMDVEGTLWIDSATLGPQRLEYRYTSLPWAVKSDKVGGHVDFRRLEGGPWVVHRWWIRSPRVGVRTVRVTQWDEPRQRFALAAVVEEGGEVTRVRLRDGRVEGLSPAPPGWEPPPGPAHSGPGAR